MSEKRDEAFVINGVIFPVKELRPEEIAVYDEAGFLRAEWDGYRWLFPSAQRPPYGPPVTRNADRSDAGSDQRG